MHGECGELGADRADGDEPRPGREIEAQRNDQVGEAERRPQGRPGAARRVFRDRKRKLAPKSGLGSKQAAVISRPRGASGNSETRSAAFALVRLVEAAEPLLNAIDSLTARPDDRVLRAPLP